jgi:hypothetical protein
MNSSKDSGTFKSTGASSEFISSSIEYKSLTSLCTLEHKIQINKANTQNGRKEMIKGHKSTMEPSLPLPRRRGPNRLPRQSDNSSW